MGILQTTCQRTRSRAIPNSGIERLAVWQGAGVRRLFETAIRATYLESKGHMKVLVTGGSGFVGSGVVEAMVAAGHEVKVFDIIPPRHDVAFHDGDLRDLDAVTAAASGFDTICHLGAVGDVYLAFSQPYLAADLNVRGTAHVMEAALANNVGKVIYACTWEVYGAPIYQPIDEDHPTRPDHPYNITKLAGELLALSYGHLKHVPIVSLRLGTCYGPGMRPNSVFSIFAAKAKAKQPITIAGTGAQSRQFTHVSDASLAFVRALAFDGGPEVFNIVGREEISILQLAELVRAIYPTSIEFTSARAGDIAPARVSSAKAERGLAWKPEIPFSTGLRDLIAEPSV